MPLSKHASFPFHPKFPVRWHACWSIDNQFVRQGDLLLEIDGRDYQIQIAKAAAGVGMAENETRRRADEGGWSPGGAAIGQEPASIRLCWI